MIKVNSNIVSPKGSRLVLLLFCCLFSQMAIASCPSDTIKIDGKYVIIEQVETDFPNEIDPPEEDKNKKPPSKGSYFLQAELAPILNRTGLSYDQPQDGDVLNTVNEFLGEPFENSFGMGIHVGIGYRIEKSAFSIVSGLGYQYSSFKSRYFTELDILDQDLVGYDEFIGFYSGAGGELFQVVRFQVDDLAFKDSSVVINTSEDVMKSHQIQIPLLLRYESQKSSLKRFNLEVSAGLGMRLLFNTGSMRTVLLNANGQYDEMTIKENDLKSIVPYALMRVGAEYSLLDRKTSLFCNIQMNYGLGSLNSTENLLIVRHREIAIGIGIRRNLSNN